MSSKGETLHARREDAIEAAKARILEDQGEAGDSVTACTGRCGDLATNFACEFCERHVLQHDGSWIVQTLE